MRYVCGCELLPILSRWLDEISHGRVHAEEDEGSRLAPQAQNVRHNQICHRRVAEFSDRYRFRLKLIGGRGRNG